MHSFDEDILLCDENISIAINQIIHYDFDSFEIKPKLKSKINPISDSESDFPIGPDVSSDETDTDNSNFDISWRTKRQSKKYYEDTKLQRSEYNVKYKELNKEKIRLRAAEYYKANRERIIKRNNAYSKKRRNAIGLKTTQKRRKISNN